MGRSLAHRKFGQTFALLDELEALQFELSESVSHSVQRVFAMA
jgi:hypothetical protein